MASANPAATASQDGRDAESTTITSTGSSSAASAVRHRRSSSGRSCVQTTTATAVSCAIEDLLEQHGVGGRGGGPRELGRSLASQTLALPPLAGVGELRQR